MKRATVVLAVAVGTHCASGADPRADDEAVSAVGASRPRGHQAEVVPAGTGSLQAGIATRLFDRQTEVLSRVRGDDGVTYVAGLFSGRTAIGDWVLKSRGEDDVYVARVEADGRVAWARAVGSEAAESSPEITLQDARVRLFAMTSGEADCGGASLARWSSPMFFICVFSQEDGRLVGGGAFPTGSP